MNYPILSLYYFESCPFCQIVLAAIKDLSIKVELRDIRKDELHSKKLLNDTGRQTVPCLYIDNKPMFESRDIVNWLQKNQSNLEKA
ncbi:MAG: glutathione S-transferase N-terminal domain-containing protein [Halobacteriovoraceae bacterium]|nr:glutathione S-transferase N-terminal domain-containing protein [Halobacteriovoraceae bacterium]